MSSISAFRKQMVTSNLEDNTDWDDFNNRRVRYAYLWAGYENTLYDNVHTWAKTYRYNYQLYLSTRCLINPSFVIAEHFKDKIWGGILDEEAGKGGAIPLSVPSESLRPNIAEIFKWSNWQVRKDIVTLKGTVLGDIAIRVVDNVQKGRVYLEIVEPSTIKDIEIDDFGHVKSYSIQYDREHPDNEDMDVTYTEEVTREGDSVVTSTYLNGDLYAYPDNIDRSGTARASWSEPYGFIPLVFIKHVDTGDVYGWSELHVARSRINELDDLTSMLSDQIRKTVNVKWFGSGIDNKNPIISKTAVTTDRPEPWREESNLITTSNENAKMTAMVAELDLEGTMKHIDRILDSLERDYPSLLLHRLRTEGSAISGRALRIAREPVEAKIKQRRALYDAALVDALQMGLSIGGMRGYFKGISLESYAKGDLDIKVIDRPVYIPDPQDQADMDQARWLAVKAGVEAGAALEGILAVVGYDEDQIERLTKDGKNIGVENDEIRRTGIQSS